jgi:hypothetical protein
MKSSALNNFIIFSEKQVSKIIQEYINYYNTMRPHQGINSIPNGKPPNVIKSDFSTQNISKSLCCKVYIIITGKAHELLIKRPYDISFNFHCN